MRIVIIDETMRRKLHNLQESLELCDRAGNLLATVQPQFEPIQYDFEPKISQEEIERCSASKEPGYTTKQVIAYLKSL